ncbi:hypothetical protein [Actinomadura macrotermitis]|uniref:Mce-associated membrane protein n=1 Tax=Actinomadura macrotermitis TaxID=2585200 RepID=A0A7K0BSP2_9ACTN|nr:hypothetical protein [Actinomadura macrotermitis]MQY04056.1 hypothetical protein [Actinomadura macrotermitis]
MRRAAWALVLVAAVFAGWSAWTFWQSGDAGAAAAPGRDRDQVLKAGKAQIAALNSMDPGHMETGLQAWLNASTGELNEQLRRDLPTSRKKIQQARTGAAGTVLDAAVTVLDAKAGDARIIASVQIRLTPPAGDPMLQRKRYEAGLTRTPDGWRLKSLSLIPSGGRA